MSASDSNTAIYLTDTKKQIETKVTARVGRYTRTLVCLCFPRSPLYSFQASSACCRQFDIVCGIAANTYDP